jgi:predicted nucleotidyltransferase
MPHYYRLPPELQNLSTIVKLKFGSHLYGTATETSDLDIKAIYIPSPRDILLQAVQPAIVRGREKAVGEKNTVKDTDFEAYSPHKFLSLLAEGQIVALDMLFAPPECFIDTPSTLWAEIQALAPSLFNKKAASFFRYCRQQAHKYGIKGYRIAAARKAGEVFKKALSQYPSNSKLSLLEKELEELSTHVEYIHLGYIKNINGETTQYVEICGKKVLYTASIKTAHEIVQNLISQYGARALAAEKNENIDWKALSHAVRIGYEAIEFLTTHNITFPRPEADHLIAIKQGKVAFKMVAEEIESLLTKIEEASLISTLPDSYDSKIIDTFIEHLYRQQIVQE